MRNVWTQKTQINAFYNWAPEVAQSVIRFGHSFSLWCWLHALLKLTVILLTRSLLVVRFLFCNTVCAEWNIILRRSRIVCGAVAIENAIHTMPSYAESHKQHNRNCFISFVSAHLIDTSREGSEQLESYQLARTFRVPNNSFVQCIPYRAKTIQDKLRESPLFVLWQANKIFSPKTGC